MFADPVSSARSVTEKPPRCVTSVSVNGQLICRNSLMHRRRVLEIFDYYIALYRHYVPWSLNWNKKRDNEVQCSPLWMTPTGLEDIHATPCHNICHHDARRVDEWKVNDDAAAWHQKRIVRPVAGPQSATTRTVEQISGPPAIHTTHQRHHRFMYSRPSLVHESLNNSSFTSGLVMIEYTFFRLVHSRASKRERERERERNGKRSPRFRCDTQSYAPKSLEVVGRVCWYRMPLSHVFVLRRFEDTRESNYGHPSFLSASSLRWIIRADDFIFRRGGRLHVPAELSQLECSNELIMQKIRWVGKLFGINVDEMCGYEEEVCSNRACLGCIYRWILSWKQVDRVSGICFRVSLKLNSRIYERNFSTQRKRDLNKVQTNDVSSNLRVYRLQRQVFCNLHTTRCALIYNEDLLLRSRLRNIDSPDLRWGINRRIRISQQAGAETRVWWSSSADEEFFESTFRCAVIGNRSWFSSRVSRVTRQTIWWSLIVS